MARQKTDKQFDDAKGNTHKHFVDGRSEIYCGGYDKDAQYAEITDEADEAVNRKRFVRMEDQSVEDTLIVRDDPEEPTPGLDFDDPEIEDEH